tara:strand:+ start:22738 stop:23898 length:1161 start_codon:yes stop_codon:yes gene_type:complete
MSNTNLAEGHEKTATGASTYQNDGLRDTDVLTSPSLTNNVERGLGNGVIPITLNRYDEANRNNPVSGNCCVRPNGTLGSTKELYVDVGVVQLDGMFYNVGSASVLDIGGSANYHSSVHGSAIPNGTNPTDEAILLVYVDPRLPNNVGFTYGSYVETSTGVYPQSPSGHLVKQNTVLAAVRVGKGASNPVILAIEDKRVFNRPGPVALSAIEHSDGTESSMRNDFIAGLNAANLPITDLGVLFARNPSGIHTGIPQGIGQTHLFFQSDIGLGLAPGGGGTYQITPIHRTAKTDALPYPTGSPTVLPFGNAAPAGLLFKPLVSEEDGVTSLITVEAYDASHLHVGTMIEGLHYTVTPTELSLNDPASLPPPLGTATTVVITYVHAGHV